MSGERVVLALDTASAPGGVAVGAGGRVLAEVVLGVAVRHSELVLPAIDFALRAAGATLAEVDAIVCGSGPGSFTGVRIAAATAKGLAHARGIPLFAFSSLVAAAASASMADTSSAAPVCALFDARRGEAYAGCWTVTDDGVETLLEPMAGAIDDVVARLEHLDPLYVGDGAWRNRARIEAAGGRIAATGATAGCAGALLRLHALAPEATPVDAAHWEPSYIRAPNVTAPRAGHGTGGDR